MDEITGYSSCVAYNVNFREFMLMGIGIFLICFFGIIGNALSTLVLVKSKFQSTVNLLLVGLTFCDTIVILYAVASFAIPITVGYFQVLRGYNQFYFPLIAPFLLPIALTGQTGSVYFTMAVTIERFLVVCWPLYAKHWCTKRRSRFYTIAVFIFSILFNIPRWFELEVIIPEGESRQGANKTKNQSVHEPLCYVLTNSALRKDVYYTYYYVNWLYVVFMYIIPFLVLAILNTSIYRHIKWANASRLRMTLTKYQNREQSIAQMLVCVVIVFLICNVLAMVNNALESFWETEVNILIDLSNFLVTFNSCCNFAIYYIFGQKFRKCFISVWNEYFPCCQLSSKPQRGASTSCQSTRTELEVRSLK